MDAAEKKKPGLALVIGMSKKPKAADDAEPMDSDEEESGEYDAAAGEMFDALKSGDEAGFKAALRACMKAC